MISNTIRLLELQALSPNAVAAIFLPGRSSSYPGLASGNYKHVYVYRMLRDNLTCYTQKFPSKIIYLQTSSFVESLRGVHLSYLKKISVHVMKAIAQHGVVNQLMLKVGIIGTA